MLYNLSTGKTINIPTKFFIDMTNEEFELEIQNLVALDMGFDIYDSFEDSVLKNGEVKIIKIKEAIIEPDEDSILPLLDDDIEDFFIKED